MSADRMHRVVRIGAGAGYSGDRIEPAVELAEKGALDYLAFECLAERTIALAQAARRIDPDAGFDRRLEERMLAVLPAARRNGVRIITNMGAANPLGGARAVTRVARKLGLHGLKTAAVLGDDVLDLVRFSEAPLTDRRGRVSDLGESIVSANAYLGAGPVVEALRGGADVVITGRIGDPALFLAPLIHEYGWAEDDWDTLGRGTMIGHLLECAGQLTGGYFADPGIKDVPDLARLGFPLAEVSADGSAVFSKIAGTGGLLSVATCKEQLLYEILDPTEYVQADVSADFSSARFEQLARDRVRVTGGGGRRRPDTLKVSIGYLDGFIGEGQISYAGPTAVARARLALEVVRQRLEITGVAVRELQLDLIGIDAVDRTGRGAQHPPREVRARIAGRTDTREQADRIGAEVEALYTNGPAGGGGAWASSREVTAIASTMIPRDQVCTSIHYEVA